jgi:hypothetical protein
MDDLLNLLNKVREIRRLQSESEGRGDFGPAFERYVAAAVDLDWVKVELALSLVVDFR